jgi:hypothetical protein
MGFLSENSMSIFNRLSFARKIALCSKPEIYNIRSTIYDIRTLALSVAEGTQYE